MNAYTKHERLLTIEGLNLEYKGKQVLRDVNLHVDNIVRPGHNQGQVIALLGPSGSGKTQLFRCISGVNLPTSGTIKLGAQQEAPAAGHVGVVQQSYPLLNHRTVWSQLLLVAPTKEKQERAEALLMHFKLADKKSAFPLELSGGQRQRVSIIQQLLASDLFLLMDEPFSGLDVMSKERVYETIREVSATSEHNTIIFTTHDIESAVHLADEVWVIGKKDGKDGTTVVERIDLAAMGLAWNTENEKHPLFWPTVQRIKELFKTL